MKKRHTPVTFPVIKGRGWSSKSDNTETQPTSLSMEGLSPHDSGAQSAILAYRYEGHSSKSDHGNYAERSADADYSPETSGVHSVALHIL